MQKGIIKAVVLSIIFAASVTVFSFMTNQENEDLTTVMEDATLPVLTLYTDDIEINTLFGYTEKMNGAYMRDTITPISDNRMLPIKIQTYQRQIDAIHYEIRSLDASRLVANATVEAFAENKGIIETELAIQNLLEEGCEYLFTICLESNGEEIYYYTRIMEAEDCYVTESLAFVQDFHNKTFDKEEADSLSMYLERAEADNTTLQYTSIHSSLKQISWADFDGERLNTVVPSIKEVTPTYNVIVMNYVMTRVGEDGASEYYNVEEYYRVRYTKQRMYLLNFERTMNEIFRAENDHFEKDAIALGIRSKDVEYKASDTGNIVAFVQEGELWSYNRNENTLAKVFSFRGYEGIDQRENNNAHEIRVVNVDEAGSITYIVYGYMNRGLHEGEVGILINRYDSLVNTNEEVLFIPSDQSYEIMKSDLGQLMYVNDGGVFFLMIGKSVYSVDLTTFETEEIISGIKPGEFAVSESNRLFAWIEPGDELGSAKIHIIDFMTEQRTKIEAHNKIYLKPLAFMEEDLIYGIIEKDDVVVEATGNVTYPMLQINIAEITAGEVQILKTYYKEDYRVASIEIDGFTIYLNRIKHNGSMYVNADQDMIMNREGDSNELVKVVQKQNGVKQTQTLLSLKNSTTGEEPKLLTPKETLLESAREVVIEHDELLEHYYVYAKGKVLLSTDNVSSAIKLANESMGVVIDHKQQYVWKRTRKTSQTAFKNMLVGDEDKGASNIVQCLNAMLQHEDINISVSALLEQGETPKEILSNALREATVFDLSGCVVDEVLYYVSNGATVLAMTDAEKAVLIIGYDSSHVSLYDPVSNSTYRKNIDDANEMFEKAGSVFFTYMK